MKLFSFFTKDNKHKEAKEQKTKLECDQTELDEIFQLIVDIHKLIATYQDDDKHQRFYEKHQEQFERLKASIESIHVILPTVFELFPLFDFQDVSANGFRSYFSIIKCCARQLQRQLHLHQTCFRMNRSHYEHSFIQYSVCLDQLTVVCKYLVQMMLIKQDTGSLFLNKSDNEDLYRNMMDSYENLSCDVFYGQCLGFYLCDECQYGAKFLCSLQLGLGHAMAMPRSDLELFVSTVVNGAQSLVQESKRAGQMTRLFRQATVEFCKQFWNLVDHPLLVNWAHIVLPSLHVLRSISLEPVPLDLPSKNDRDCLTKVYPPGSQGSWAAVNIRLLSHRIWPGMDWHEVGLPSVRVVQNAGSEANAKTNSAAPAAANIDGQQPSNCILFHCHGGGFVAQSSQSHDSYLRSWAVQLDCPIVSVDYSHAPEYPYPRAHEECLYAYCWMLRSLPELGCSSDCRIVMCGDSAGGNLALGVVLRVLQLGLAVPAGLLLAYPATLVDFVPSPARMLGILDPVLPIGVLARCLLAYGGVNEDNLASRVSSAALSSMEDIDSKTGDEARSNKKHKPFLEADTFDSTGAKIFRSKLNTVSPITLLENANIPSDPFMSPLTADKSLFAQFPPMSVFASQFDPLLDDSIALCRRVAEANPAIRVRLRVMDGLTHGFLSMASPVSRQCMAACQACMDEARLLLIGDVDEMAQAASDD